MSEYAVAKGSKLKLKGEKSAPKKKKRKHTDTGGLSKAEIEAKEKYQQDTEDHGRWWKVNLFEEISGTIAIEFGNSRSYVKALDDGRFTLGAPHRITEQPSPEEIFTAIKINDNKIALKSGYGKYLKVDKDGEVIGRSDAVGAQEQWEPVFEESSLALMAADGCFLSVNPEDDGIIARGRKAGSNEMITLRCQSEKIEKKDDKPTEEQAKNVKEIEVNYVKKFQKFQDKKMRVNKEDDTQIAKALDEGTLHETLLDRRAKMKADRYCK